MSFQHKSFWMQQDVGCIPEENVGHKNSSRIEPKRSRQCSEDTVEPELFNKKQAVEAVSGGTVSGVSHVNVSLWDNKMGFHSVTGQFSDRLFGSGLVRGVNFVDKNIPPIRSENVNMGRKDFENQYHNDPSMSLSISHAISDPSSCLNFGGIRKVKVNQVRYSDNCLPASVGRSYHGSPASIGHSDICVPASTGHSFCRADSSSISIGVGYNKNDGNISLGPNYNNGNADIIAMGTRIAKTNENLLQLSHTFNKEDGNFMMMGHNYGKGDDNILSWSQPNDRRDGNFMSMGQSYEKEDNNLISLDTSFTKGHENFISISPTYSEPGGNSITNAPSYGKGNDHITSMGPSYDKESSNIPSYDKGDSSSLPMAHNHNKDEGSTISFRGFHEDTELNSSGGIICVYDMFMNNHNQIQALDSQRDLTESNSQSLVNSTPKPNTKNDSIIKNKETKTTKKAATNNFPSNVKSLLSTGIFDGIHVKYVSWSREKSLTGIIKGSGYLCSCDDCNQSKALNAYEFELHAGAKTKHPNNHIYFENGKTIYSVVQELKKTPRDKLFDAIQNVTGSSINQKNFSVWKVSYLAATRELQRIYGKDEVIIPS